MTQLTHGEFAEALLRQRAANPIIVPHIVAGQKRFDGQLIMRHDPSDPANAITGCHDAPVALVHEAVAASRAAQREWQRVPLAKRIEHVRKAFTASESRLDDWALRIALEIGKTYGSARAEAVETYEFLRFYPQYLEAPDAYVDERTPGASGVVNDSVLRPYGVFGAITPFNYPMALSGGPAIAAVLTGNGVVIKSSHHAPWSGQAVYEMFEAMDLPPGLVNIVHGADEPGRALVASDIDGISFVGSVDVGLAIIKAMASGPYPRPVIAEMGGKNPVIVTDTADLDDAAAAITFSAFDLTGQKCSALSRVLVTPGAHDRLVELVSDRAKALKMADPAEADSFAGPVVSEEAFSRYARIVEQARADGFQVFGGDAIANRGYLVGPVVISGVPAEHALACEEHFLPILTISKVADFAEAMRVANMLATGLTAGVFTADREEARTFLEGIEAGCINVNVPGHATTGWFPGPQTFGGWKASGSTGKQAYGKWYVLQFARQQARKVAANMGDLLTH